jgi:organic radical activating enzyme
MIFEFLKKIFFLKKMSSQSLRGKRVSYNDYSLDITTGKYYDNTGKLIPKINIFPSIIKKLKELEKEIIDIRIENGQSIPDRFQTYKKELEKKAEQAKKRRLEKDIYDIEKAVKFAINQKKLLDIKFYPDIEKQKEKIVSDLIEELQKYEEDTLEHVCLEMKKEEEKKIVKAFIGQLKK